jgi:Tol biopolymer transport system component
MKKIHFSAIILIAFVFSSCVTYQMVSQGESFDALTKITDSKKICAFPNGGDNGKNLVFSAQDDGGAYNIYMKDNVLSSALIQKTSGNNYNICPNYCAAKDLIAFQYLTKTNFDIYYINASKGKAITQITSTDENEYNPCFSRDGKMIVFEKGASPKYYVKYTTTNKATTYIKGIRITENQIWIKNLETGELKMIGLGSYPKFSPDDSKIVFVKYELNKSKSAETGTICIISTDGESQSQITGPDLGYATWPNWSPDAKNIVFQLTKTNKLDSDIYTISVDGENLKQHTVNKSNDFAPYWTSDNYIFFTSDRGAKPGGYQIWRFKIIP